MNSNEVPNMENMQNMEKEIARENFSKWNEALASKDAKKVAALYTEECNFLPTMSNVFVKDRAGAEEYFIEFCKNNPEGKIVDDRIYMLSESAYEHVGHYDFTVGPDDNRKVVSARFTYLWIKDETGSWMIKSHHSSLVPTKH